MENFQEHLWSKTAQPPEFQPLEGDAKTDVLIIGGGAAGLLCAYFLQQKGIDYILAEGSRILSGVTGGTTAKLTFQHGLIYSRLIKIIGFGKARLYLEANRKALDVYRELSRKFPCELEEKQSYVYLRDNAKKLEKEAEAVRRLGFPAELVPVTALPFETAGAVMFPNQAQFNPMLFFSQLAKGLNIYEKTFIRQLMPHKAVTSSGTITARKIIVASHFPFLNKHGAYYLKMYQNRSYVIALENAQDVGGMYVDGESDGLSFRNYKNLLLLGGGGHRTGKRGGNWRELRAFAGKYYPSAKEKYYWAAQDCMTLDGVPYIGRYSSGSEDIYTATGFNKWGMTSSMTAAMLLCDLINCTGNKYSQVFSPSRSIVHPQLFVNAGEAALNLLTPSRKRCPHLGCALKWNNAEHSWDCPCHGSRFSENGQLLDNPSTGDMQP